MIDEEGAPEWNQGADLVGRARRVQTARIRLATREPFAGEELVAFLVKRAVPGVEEAGPDGSYRRVLSLPHGAATVALHPATDHVEATLLLGDRRDLEPAVQRCRRLLDLDADPVTIDDALGADPLLAPLVAATPGRRSPGAVDGAELLVRAILGQQVSVAGARTIAGRLAGEYGEVIPDALRGDTALTRRFPEPDAIAALDPDALPMPRARGRALVTVAARIADGSVVLDPGADRAGVEAALVAVSGIGPWTARYVAMRALGDPDVFLETDLGVLRGLATLGGPSTPKEAAARAQPWRPWRSYALHHLWAAG